MIRKQQYDSAILCSPPLVSTLLSKTPLHSPPLQRLLGKTAGQQTVIENRWKKGVDDINT